MKTYTPEELKEILAKHALWLTDSTKGARADLSCANLYNANLYNANLYNADLYNADLRNANLRNADLRNASLYNADLRNANLRNASLYNASLRNAYLQGADLRNAYLQGADLEKTALPDFQIAPAEGAFIAYKKVDSDAGRAVLKLEIPKGAKRTSSLVGRKCRASKVKVLAWALVTEPAGTWHKTAAKGALYSSHNPNFVYKVGKVAKVEDLDDDIRIECTRGIHFFMTEKEAREY